MKLKFGSGAEDPTVVFDKIVQTASNDSWVGMQGMRIYEDSVNNVYAMPVATSARNASHQHTDANVEFGLATLDTNGDVQWFRQFPATNEFQKETGPSSHPYAFTLAPGGAGYVIAGIGFKDAHPWGRLAKINPGGELLWDQRFRNCDHESVDCDEVNTECYGVSVTPDDGYVVTCGTGCTGRHCSARESNWMTYVHRTDAAGNALWSKDYSTQEANNAGEYISTTRDGGYAVYIDANSWGSKSTGGNFGLMLLQPDTEVSQQVQV